MFEPWYGCAEEALLRRVASPYGEPEGALKGPHESLVMNHITSTAI